MSKQNILCALESKDGSCIPIGDQFPEYLPQVGELIEYEKVTYRVHTIKHLVGPNLFVSGNSAIVIKAKEE